MDNINFDITPLTEAISNFGISFNEVAKPALKDFGEAIANIKIENHNCSTIAYAPKDKTFKFQKLVCECCGGKIDRYNKTCLYCGTEYM